jgi:cyclase
VKYVVNTHFHFDHAHGNQMYAPGIEVIGHDFTREMLSHPDAIFQSRTYKGFTEGLPAQIDELKRRVAAESRPAEKARLQDELQVQESYRVALGEVKVTPPTIAVETGMTLTRGGREIRLMFIGRGHTGGDLVVWLPKEGVLCSGDLLVNGLAYMGDGYIDEWIGTLEELKQFEFKFILPGHGEAFTDRQRIDHFKAYLQDFWNKALAFKRQGVSAEQAAQRIDMTSHRGNFPEIQSAGVDARAMIRAYERIDELGLR